MVLPFAHDHRVYPAHLRDVSLNSCRGKLAGAQSDKASVGRRLHDHAQSPVVIVIERDKAEGLEDAPLALSDWV